MLQEPEVLPVRTKKEQRPVRAVRVVVIRAGRLVRPRRKMVGTANPLALDLLKK